MKMIAIIYFIFSTIFLTFNIENLRAVSISDQMCYRSHEEQFTWIGKAYIIATKFQVPQEVILAAEACGFLPQVISATLPYREHFDNNRGKMFQTCFAIASDQFQLSNSTRISLTDMSRVCSHRRAMQLISQDQTMLDTDWALIMEDDVVLNPEVKIDLARLYTREAMKHSLWDSSDEGFLYLGICDGTCKMDITVFSDDPFGIGKSCHGSCTHAYAVTKFTAKTFFQKVYASVDLLKGKHLQIDRVVKNYFKDNSEHQGVYPTAHIVGVNFQSPDDPKRVGILYQANHTSTYGASDVFIPQTCFIMRGDGGSITKMLQKYATLVGFCLSRSVNPLHCASFVSGDGDDSSTGAFDAFMKGFGIREVKCVPNSVVVQDNANMPAIASVAYGTTFVGSFESTQLFPGVGTFLRQLLTTSSPYIRTNTAETVQVYSAGSSTNWLSGWLQSSQVAITTTPCAPAAVEVCVLISGKSFSESEKDNKEKENARKFYSAAWKHLLNKYRNGVALRIVMDKATIKESQLQSFLALPTSQNGSSSSICVRSLTKYGDSKDKRADVIDHDMWAIRQLQGCSRIVMARSLLGWWGAYLTSGEVIISSQVKHTLPEWTVI